MPVRPFTNEFLGIVVAVVCLGSSALVVRYVRRCLRSGAVSFGGNSPSTAMAHRYRRSELPGLYWFGIVLYSAGAVGLSAFGLYVIVLMTNP